LFIRGVRGGAPEIGNRVNAYTVSCEDLKRSPVRIIQAYPLLDLANKKSCSNSPKSLVGH